MEGIKSFLEIGCINDALLDEAKKEGWETYALDINESSNSKHNHIIGNIEDESVMDSIPQVDAIWASHIFEHFHYPLKVAQDLYDKLNPGGYLFVAMPDPWFINWNTPLQWDHWVLREHHILWDMDSFIDKLLEIGYQLVFAKRNSITDCICNRDYHIMLKK